MVLAQARGSNEKQFCRMLWDFTVQMDHEICGRIPDAIVVQKGKNLCQIINFPCPYDGRLDTKELEKIEHHQNLARKYRNIWSLKVKVIPLVIGTLGITFIKLTSWLKKIGFEIQIIEL